MFYIRFLLKKSYFQYIDMPTGKQFLTLKANKWSRDVSPGGESFLIHVSDSRVLSVHLQVTCLGNKARASGSGGWCLLPQDTSAPLMVIPSEMASENRICFINIKLTFFSWIWIKEKKKRPVELKASFPVWKYMIFFC